MKSLVGDAIYKHSPFDLNTCYTIARFVKVTCKPFIWMRCYVILQAGAVGYSKSLLFVHSGLKLFP